MLRRDIPGARKLVDKRVSEGWYLWKLLYGLQELGRLGEYRMPPAGGIGTLNKALEEVVPCLEAVRLVKWAKKCAPQGEHPAGLFSMDGNQKLSGYCCDYSILAWYPELGWVRQGCFRSPRRGSRACSPEHDLLLAVAKQRVHELLKRLPDEEKDDGYYHVNQVLSKDRGVYQVKFIGLGAVVPVPAGDLPADYTSKLSKEFSLEEERKEVEEMDCSAEPKSKQYADKKYHTAGVFQVVTDNRLA
jgi:hypothetical protein